MLEVKENLVSTQIHSDEAFRSRYYLNPLFMIIHMAMAIERYRSDFQTLARDLGLSLEDLNYVLSELSDLGVIELKNGSARVVIENVHLPRESAVFAPWRNLIRNLAASRMQVTPCQNQKSFAAVFTADAASFEAIWRHILQALEKIEVTAKKAASEDVVHLQLDLFRWTAMGK